MWASTTRRHLSFSKTLIRIAECLIGTPVAALPSVHKLAFLAGFIDDNSRSAFIYFFA